MASFPNSAAFPNAVPMIPEGVIDAGTHKVNYVLAFQITHCVVCNHTFTARDTVVAIGRPYHAAVHHQCAHLLRFDGLWPHNRPASAFASHVAQSLQTPAEAQTRAPRETQRRGRVRQRVRSRRRNSNTACETCAFVWSSSSDSDMLSGSR